MMKSLARWFGFAFHVVLALFLIAVAGLALISGSLTLRLEMLPWTGSTLALWMLALGFIGLLTAVLAMRHRMTVLFLLWCLAVVVLLLKGYVFGSYHFAGGGAAVAFYLILGSWVALAGAWFEWRRPVRGR